MTNFLKMDIFIPSCPGHNVLIIDSCCQDKPPEPPTSFLTLILVITTNKEEPKWRSHQWIL